MKLHPEELALAQAYDRAHAFEGLSDAQMGQIMARGKQLYHWFQQHRGFHMTLNTAVLAFLFLADWWLLLRLPRLLLPAGADSGTGWILLAGALVGSVHSYLLYTLGVFTLHEGAAHKLIYPPEGPMTRALQALASNLCRLAASDPEYYAPRHMAHHSKFGTEHDAEFLNFVQPRRYWLTFLPFATFINFSDFIIHRPATYTRSRILTAILSLTYIAVYATFQIQEFGLLFTAVAFLVFTPHVGFYLDRLRQYTEHNLMPLDNKNGSRSFGVGFWGLLVGGGPWGSPCHWTHHLVASLPWYQQIVLHRYVVKLLTPAQRRQFLIEPVVGFPKLWWRLIRESNRFMRQASA